jgi:hypothetical protein
VSADLIAGLVRLWRERGDELRADRRRLQRSLDRRDQWRLISISAQIQTISDKLYQLQSDADELESYLERNNHE